MNRYSRSVSLTNLARSNGPLARSNGARASSVERRALLLCVRRLGIHEIDDGQFEFARRLNHLHWPIARVCEAGAQRFMPAHDLAKSRGQCANVQRALDPESAGDVVDRTMRLQLIEEQEPRLRDGSGRGSAFAPVRDCAFRRGFGARDLCSQTFDRRRLEYRTQRQLDIEFLAHARNQLGREQRMSAQFEEVVVNAGCSSFSTSAQMAASVSSAGCAARQDGLSERYSASAVLSCRACRWA